MAELKRQIAVLPMLLARIEQLEKSNAELQGQRQPAVAALENRVAAVEQANELQTDRIAQGLATENDIEWARNLRWQADFRYRHEQFDIQGAPSDRLRHRIRARFGMEARISSTLAGAIQIATGDISDPRSGNVTLDDAGRRKEIALDLAYVDWKPRDGMLVTIGKQKQPWFKAGNSLFFDDEVSTEGIAFRYGGRTGPFATAWSYWLEEMSGAADSNLLGAQFGYAFDGGLTLAAGYWDYGAVQGQPVLNFAGSPAGNSSYLAAADCIGVGTTRCYLHDYNIVEADLQWSGRLGGLPLTLFGAYLENLDPGTMNSGYDLGFLLGQASDPGGWEFGLLYQDVERDAQFGALLDSDFADGATQSRGFRMQGALAPVRNMTIKAAYFINDRDYGTPVEVDYKRLQFDLNYKF